MPEINLLQSLPKVKRNIEKRLLAKDPLVIAESKKFGQMYWDGPREYGYGGYKYDGRWLSVAKEIINLYKLQAGMRVLDVGCGKGFLVKDLLIQSPDLEVFGLDVSEYAVHNCEPEVVGRLHLKDALQLPFPDRSFDFVISLNTIHNFTRENAITALREIQRVSKGASFVQVDSYLTVEQKEVFESWVLTAQFHDYPPAWLAVFEEAGYTGDYFWTIID